ncbi:hypothetical protein IFM89_006539 [Coptis chinensis]|uniref:Myb/SANT-like domain-containing protein n=1 Tax=Coptis chinensis TaxID=261450 RepID=A0A835INA0_9MAGN|nr:hypothetical protein IFM89_006539 [Coptis chinensis]
MVSQHGSHLGRGVVRGVSHLGGKRADNGWRKESLKRIIDEINTPTWNELCFAQCQSRLKTMRLAWQVLKHAIDASGFGLSFNKETKRIDADENAWGRVMGNSGFDDDMVDGDDSRQTQGDGGDDSDASESSAFGAPSDTSGDTSQTESGPRSTTPTSKKTRKSRFFEDIPEPPSFKVLTEAVAKIAEALKPEPQEEEVDQIDLLKDALRFSSRYESRSFS